MWVKLPPQTIEGPAPPRAERVKGKKSSDHRVPGTKNNRLDPTVSTQKSVLKNMHRVPSYYKKTVQNQHSKPNRQNLTHFRLYLGTWCIFFKTDFCIETSTPSSPPDSTSLPLAARLLPPGPCSSSPSPWRLSPAPPCEGCGGINYGPSPGSPCTLCLPPLEI